MEREGVGDDELDPIHIMHLQQSSRSYCPYKSLSLWVPYPLHSHNKLHPRPQLHPPFSSALTDRFDMDPPYCATI